MINLKELTDKLESQEERLLSELENFVDSEIRSKVSANKISVIDDIRVVIISYDNKVYNEIVAKKLAQKYNDKNLSLTYMSHGVFWFYLKPFDTLTNETNLMSTQSLAQLFTSLLNLNKGIKT